MPKHKSWKWTMYPKLHNQVSQLLQIDNLHLTFHDVDDDKGCIESYDTNIMGRFRCYNKNCATEGWGSMKIAITIRMYANNQYNARVYSQHCKACNSCSRPFLDEKSYVERVTYRIKKWKGVQVERPKYEKKAKGEHEIDLCEGCKAGHCTEGYRD